MISHEHKCIFVHIPKVAGQSIEHVFLNLLGLTWETRTPLLLFHNDNIQIGPPSLAHLHAKDYVKNHYISQGIFNEYFKFAFVRNPWDRMVSFYRYSRYSQLFDFDYFLKKIFLRKIWRDKHWFVGPQNQFIYDKSETLLVDYVGRFETLHTDFNYVCNKLDLECITLPHVNRAGKYLKDTSLDKKKLSKYIIGMIGRIRMSSKYTHYHDYYNAETEGIVRDLYHKDIELFGYSFNESKG